MDNAERFNSLVNDLLNEHPQYKNEIGNFQRYLVDRKLQNRVFNLNVSHIDDYFAFSYDEKIGAVPTLTTHISALKLLFDHLITEDIDVKPLYAYIDTAGFKERLSENLEKGSKKQVIEICLLKSILYKMDNYIDDNINAEFRNISTKRRFLEIMIARLYAKLSLIIPLKPKDMLNLEIKNIIDDNVRTIEYNGVVIKVPNSVRKQIIDTIKYVEKVYSVNYSEHDKIFHFLYKVLDRQVSTSTISESFIKAYKELEISEMLMQQVIGKKVKYIHPPESYKKTAILSMLDNGTNIVYLKKLTGLDMNTLLSDYDSESVPEKIDLVSVTVNTGIVNTEFYTYL